MPPATPPVEPPADTGGDAACWLPLVCPDCGRLATPPLPTPCTRCGTLVPAAED